MARKCQVISVAQEKGGAGKTTLLCMLASFLAEDGAKVVIVDSDPLAGAADYGRQSDASELNVFYVQELDETKLPKIIRKLKQEHDVVLLDTAGIAAKTTDYALHLSDLVLIPVKAARPDMKGLVRTLKTIEAQADLREEPLPSHVIMSDIDRGTGATESIRNALIEMGAPLLNAQMLHRTGFKEFVSNGGRLRNKAARTVGREVLADMQIRGLLWFYKKPRRAAA